MPKHNYKYYDTWLRRRDMYDAIKVQQGGEPALWVVQELIDRVDEGAQAKDMLSRLQHPDMTGQ